MATDETKTQAPSAPKPGSPKEPSAPKRGPVSRALRGILKFAWRLVRTLLLLILILLVLVFVALQTGPIRGVLLQAGLDLANESLAGEIQVDRLEGNIFGSIRLRGVRVLAPNGEEALAVERLELRHRIGALLDGAVRVTELAIIGPSVTVQGTDGASLLAEAFTPTSPQVAPPPEDPGGPLVPLPITIEKIRIADGRLRLSPADDAIRLEQITLALGLQLGADIRWNALVLEFVPHGLPLALSHVRLESAGAFDGAALALDRVELEAGPHSLAIRGAIRALTSATGPTLDLDIAKLALALPALSPALRDEAVLAGSLRGPLSDLRTSATIDAALGKLQVLAQVDLSGPEPAWSAELSSEALAPARLLTDPIPELTSDLLLKAEGLGDPSGGGSVRASLDLRQPKLGTPGVAAGERVPISLPSLRLDATMDKGAPKLSLALRDEGAELDLTASMPSLPPAKATLTATGAGVDIGAWARAFGVLGADAELGELELNAEAQVTASGVEDASATLKLELFRLAYAIADGTKTAPGQTVSLNTVSLNEASIDLSATWKGEGLPEAKLKLDALALDGFGAQIDALALTLAAAPEGERVHATGDVLLDGVRAPGDVSLRSVALPFDLIAALDGSLPAGKLNLEVEGLRAGGLGVEAASGDWTIGSKKGRVSVKGPLRLEGTSVDGTLDLATATLDTDLLIDPQDSRSPFGVSAEGDLRLALARLTLLATETETETSTAGKSKQGAPKAEAAPAGPEGITSLELQAHITPPKRKGEPSLIAGRLEVKDTRVSALHIADITGLLSLGITDSFPTGALRLGLADVTIGGKLLKALRVAALRGKDGRASISVETPGDGDVRAALAVSLEWPIQNATAKGQGLRAALDTLELSLKGDGIHALPGAAFSMSPHGLMGFSGLKLRGLGALEGSAFDAAAAFDPLRGYVDVKADLTQVNLERWIGLARDGVGLPLPEEIAGEVSGHVKVRGGLANPKAEIDLAVKRGRFGAVRDLTLDLEASLVEEVLKLKGKGGWGRGTSILANIDLPLSTRDEEGQLRLTTRFDVPIQLRLTMIELNLAELSPSNERGDPLIAGVVNGAVQLDGPLNSPLGVIGLRAKDLYFDGFEAADVDTALAITEGSTVGRVQVKRGKVLPLRVEVDAPLNLVAAMSGVASADEVIERLHAIAFTLSVAFAETRLDAVPFAATLDPNLAATKISADIKAKGPLGELQLEGRVDVKDLLVGDIDTDLSLGFETKDKTLLARAEISEAEATLPMVMAKLALPDLARRILEGEYMSLLFDPESVARVEVPGIPLVRLAELQPSVGEALFQLLAGGSATASFVLRGAPVGPTLSLLATAENPLQRAAGFGDPFAKRVALDLLLGPDGARVNASIDQEPNYSALSVEGRLGLSTAALVKGVIPELDKLIFDLNVRSHDFDLRGLQAFMPEVFGASQGRLDVRVDAMGTLGTPQVEGHVTAYFEELSVAALGLYQEDILLRLELSDEGIFLDPVTILTKRGSMDLAFELETPTWKAEDMRVSAEVIMERFRVLGRDDMKAIVSGDLIIGGTVASPEVSGSLTLDEALLSPKIGGRTLHRIGPPDDVTFTSKDGLELASTDAGSKLRAGLGSMNLDLSVTLPSRRVRVSNELMDLYLEGKLNIGSNGGQPTLGGKIGVVEGEVEFYGKRFTVSDESLVAFDGGSNINPRLNVIADFDISNVDLSALGLEATQDSAIRLAVTGTAEAPKLDLSSEPPMEQTNIISIMLVGTAINASQTNDQEAGVERQTMNLFVGLATGQIARLLAGDLPIDVLRVEAGDQGLATARITIGKRLTRDLTVIYSADLGAKAEENENENEFRVQYRLTRRVQIETYVGDAGRGGVDLLLRWRF